MARWLRWRLPFAAAAGFLGFGCVVHSQQTHEWVRARASKDLQCPQAQLTIHHDLAEPNRKRAEGCGKQATYVEVCEQGHCRWVPGPAASAR